MKILALLFIWLMSYVPNTSKGTLLIKIENCKSNKGSILIAMFDSETTYMKPEKAIVKKKVSIQNGVAVIKFEGVAYGAYAFSLFHDENDNGKLDTNLFGIPKESYAFSNNASGSFGPPSFSKAKFSIKSENIQLSIKF